MPLTMSFYGSDIEKEGHVIVDRKNLIFAYPVQNTPSSKMKAKKNRDRLKSFFDMLKKQGKYINSDAKLGNDYFFNDDRHFFANHLSLYDKEAYHIHFCFKNIIDFNFLRNFLSEFLPINKEYEDLISETCVREILDIAEKYFIELQNSNKAKKEVEPQYFDNTRVIEEQYRDEKLNKFLDACDEILEANKKSKVHFPFYNQHKSPMFFSASRAKDSVDSDLEEKLNNSVECRMS